MGATYGARSVKSNVDGVRRRKRVTSAGLLAAAGGMLFGGCFSPDLSLAVCTACSDDQQWCPGELVCQDGYCVYPGSGRICEELNGAGGEAGAETSGSAGTPQAGAGTGNVAGEAGAGGLVASTGGASSSGGSPGELAIDGGALSTGCSGSELTLDIAANGGRAPFQWTLAPASDFALTPEGAHATLAGTPLSAGNVSLSVSVTDADGLRGEREWLVMVHDPPVITTTTLPSVCPSEVYAATLAATGGDGESYVWSSTLDPVTGLAIEGEQLRGTFTTDLAGSTALDVSLTVESAGCRSAPATLALEVENASADACPEITPVELVPALPAPCRGSEYAAELIVHNGKAPYVWKPVSLPEGLTFDVDSQRISGIPHTAGSVTVQVEDGAGRTVQASFELEPRDSCWLAYVSAESGVARLQLFDPVLRARRALPDDPLVGPVVDFAFSPDGRFVAYRTLGEPGTERVRVLEMSTFREQELPFESVSAYTWSTDSASLVVAYVEDQVRYLGGIDAAQAISGGSSGTPIEFPLLGSTPAAVDVGPFLFADAQVAFFSDSPPTQTVSVTRLLQGAFTTPSTLSEQYLPGATIRPAAEGFFVIPTGTFVLAYYGADGAAGVPHDQVPRELRAIAPSGRYLARVDAPDLELFRAEEASYRDDPPTDSASGCSAILAWAEGRERIACATEVDGFGVVSLFDVDTTTHELVPLEEAVRGNYEYPLGAHVQRRRLFSRSGGRFLFTTDDRVYAATLDEGTPRIELEIDATVPLPPNDNSFSALSFSPNEHFFLVHRGARLRVVELESEANRVDETLADDLPISERCEEDFRNVGSGYCGSEGPLKSYEWSSDSNWVVFQSDSGSLQVFDLRFWELREFDTIPVMESCAGDCPGRGAFAFQP